MRTLHRALRATPAVALALLLLAAGAGAAPSEEDSASSFTRAFHDNFDRARTPQEKHAAVELLVRRLRDQLKLAQEDFTAAYAPALREKASGDPALGLDMVTTANKLTGVPTESLLEVLPAADRKKIRELIEQKKPRTSPARKIDFCNDPAFRKIHIFRPGMQVRSPGAYARIDRYDCTRDVYVLTGRRGGEPAKWEEAGTSFRAQFKLGEGRVTLDAKPRGNCHHCGGTGRVGDYKVNHALAGGYKEIGSSGVAVLMPGQRSTELVGTSACGGCNGTGMRR